MRKLTFFILLAGLSALFACQSVKTTKQTSSEDPFLGEQIVWPQALSHNLKSVDINVLFPTGYRTLEEAQPYVKLMTADGKMISDYLIDKFPFNIHLTKEINSSELFVDLSIYYCRESGMAMCLKKSVLYEVKLDQNATENHLAIEYHIKDESY